MSIFSLKNISCHLATFPNIQFGLTDESRTLPSVTASIRPRRRLLRFSFITRAHHQEVSLACSLAQRSSTNKGDFPKPTTLSALLSSKTSSLIYINVCVFSPTLTLIAEESRKRIFPPSRRLVACAPVVVKISPSGKNHASLLSCDSRRRRRLFAKKKSGPQVWHSFGVRPVGWTDFPAGLRIAFLSKTCGKATFFLG